MNVYRQPRTVAQATELLGRYAEIDASLASVEAARKTELGRINAAADVEAVPLIAELKALAEKVEPWWRADGRVLAAKGDKSMQLGGCMVGTRMGRATLAHGYGDDDKAVEALRATRYGKTTTRVKYALERPATLKLLLAVNGSGKVGAAGKALAEMGFRSEQGETFFVTRIEQAGAIAG